MCVFFFFKQKTAYEMRISDWSSDVCSSDLLEEPDLERATAAETARAVLALAIAQRHVRKLSLKEILPNRSPVVPVPPQVQRSDARQVAAAFKRARHYFSGMDECLSRGVAMRRVLAGKGREARRSEEHTSELQTIMRI